MTLQQVDVESPDMAWNFTLDEIRHQLSCLGVTHVSDSQLLQLKEHLDELIAKERAQVQLTSELSRCRIAEQPLPSGGFVSNSSSDTDEVTSNKPALQKLISYSDSHDAPCPLFTSQSNNAERQVISTENYTSSREGGKPHRSSKVDRLSHLLSSDAKTESGDTVSSITDIDDSLSVVSAAEKNANIILSTPSRGPVVSQRAECVSLLSTISDSHQQESHHCHQTDYACASDAVNSTMKLQNTRSLQCTRPMIARHDYSVASTHSTLDRSRGSAWEVSSLRSSCATHKSPTCQSHLGTSNVIRRPLWEKQLERRPLPTSTVATSVTSKAGSQPQSSYDFPWSTELGRPKGRTYSKSPFRTHRLPPTRHGLIDRPVSTLPFRQPSSDSSHPPSALEAQQESRDISASEDTVTCSEVNTSESPQCMDRTTHPGMSPTELVTTTGRRVVRSARFADHPTEESRPERPHLSIDHTKPFGTVNLAEVKRPTSATTNERRSGIVPLARPNDPVSRFHSYRRIWSTHLVPGEDARRVLRWNIKIAMMHREVPLLQRNLAEISQLFGRDVVAFLERERVRHLKSLQPTMFSTSGQRRPQGRSLVLH